MQNKQQSSIIITYIICTIVLFLLSASLLIVFLSNVFGFFVKLLILVSQVILILYTIRILIIRVREIKGGYEDDLDNY